VLRRAGVSIAIKRPKGATGEVKNHWLWPEQFQTLAAAAFGIDVELVILFTLLVGTGMRISEALKITGDDVRLAESFAYVGKTKNGDPRPIHLPPEVVDALRAHPRGLRANLRVFRWTKCGILYELARKAFAAAELDPGGQPFHILRHTFGSWMRRYAGLDERGLVDTGVWRDPKSARRYTHTIVSESARRADALPIRAKSVQIDSPATDSVDI
jgi:integrase